jgi:hypothetical protein
MRPGSTSSHSQADRPEPPPTENPNSFTAGWRAGYAGAPKRGRGSEYERGWSAGHQDRILDRARHAF